MNRKLSTLYFILMILLIYSCAAPKSFVSTEREKEQFYNTWTNNMRDTSAHFYTTLNAFKKYISGKNSLDATTSNTKNTFENVDDFFKKINIVPDTSILNQINSAFDIKMFKGWYFNNIQWLKADGTIIGPIERQLIIDRQVAEQKLIELNYKKQGNGK